MILADMGIFAKGDRGLPLSSGERQKEILVIL